MLVDMNDHEDIAKLLKIRLSELKGRVAEIASQLRRPLSADSEEQATDLENQDALVGIENSRNQGNSTNSSGAKADRRGQLRRMHPVRRRY